MAPRHVISSARPLNVLIVAHDAGLFGAQRSLLEFIRTADRSVLNLRVAVPRQGPFVDGVRDLGVPVHFIDWVRWAPSRAEFQQDGLLRYWARVVLRMPVRVKALRSLLREHRIDVVYSNTVVMAEGGIAATLSGVPHMWHVHEPINGNPELHALLPARLYSALIRRLATQVVFPSDMLRQAYPGLAEACTVFSGLPLPPEADRNAARRQLVEQLGFEPRGAVIAIVGAIQPRKDHPTFVRAAAALRQRLPEARFLIVGSDVSNGLSALKRLIDELGMADAITCLGWWPHSIHQLLAAVDVLAITSLQESFGLTVIEAFAARTPVVSTRCGGPEQLVRDGVDGLLVPMSDPTAICDAWESLARNPQRRMQFGDAGRQSFVEQFTIEVHTARLTAILSAISTGKS